MLGTVDLPTFVLGALLIVLLPGPNSLYVLTVGARKGVRTGYRAACGVFLGDARLLKLNAAGTPEMSSSFRATSSTWFSASGSFSASRPASGTAAS